MSASQAEDAGPIPVSRSKTHLTRGVFCIEKQIDRIHFFDLDEIVIWRCENDPATQETTECRTPHSPEALKPQTQKREWLQLPLILLDVWMDKPEQEIHLPGPTHEDP